MSSAHNVHTDGSWLSRFDRALFAIETKLTLLGGLAVMAAMLISVANILGRKLLNMPVPGYVDIMQQIVPVMAFLGISYCQRLGGHIRMDLVTGALRGRWRWLAEFIGILVMLILSGALFYGAQNHAMRALMLGDTTDDLGIHTWPVKMVVVVMFVFLILRLFLQLWGYGRAMQTGEEMPVAVPMIEDAATQALNEAKTVSSLDEEALK